MTGCCRIRWQGLLDPFTEPFSYRWLQGSAVFPEGELVPLCYNKQDSKIANLSGKLTSCPENHVRKIDIMSGKLTSCKILYNLVEKHAIH